MRKVNLSIDEQEKHKIIKALVDHHGNKKRAAVQLDCSVRHINRLIKILKEKGKSVSIFTKAFKSAPCIGSTALMSNAFSPPSCRYIH